MGFAAYKTMHWPTGIENCATGFITHCRADLAPQIPSMQSDDLESEWPAKRGIGLPPNQTVTAGNVLEMYVVRLREEGTRESRNSSEPKRGGVMDGSVRPRSSLFASCMVACSQWLYCLLKVVVVSRRRNSIILAFKDAKISVLDFDDSVHGLRTSAPLQNTTTKENETLLAIETAYVQGEDVAARGRVLLFSVVKNPDNSQVLVSEVYSKEVKGAISALASLQGHLLIAFGPKIILHKWTGTELNGFAFFDAPPLYVVSLNILAPIGTTLVEELRGHRITAAGSDKTNRFALLFGTLDGSIGCIAPLDELNFRRLLSLQKKLVDAACHVAG
ncbi:hypothetical protein GH714_040270 [Hevea brasiliensis]|uniref:RSE1/DDB1/CPSF1 C-terminal domain-containing protein n=1 Tax=Hevea brasiliensis TaxID=3981 RepID=A0A6A6MTU0_HEVBR|nr:hypothetical protein GH714_040270 [Hevea brasiliensis]